MRHVDVAHYDSLSLSLSNIYLLVLLLHKRRIARMAPGTEHRMSSRGIRSPGVAAHLAAPCSWISAWLALRSLDGRNVALQFVSSQVLHSSRCPRCAVAQGLRRTHIRLSGAIRPERPRCCLGFSISSRVVGLHWVTVIVMFILITIITQGAHRMSVRSFSELYDVRWCWYWFWCRRWCWCWC